MKKLKILHIINNLGVGGAEKMLVLLANELSKRDDIEIYVVSLEGHGPLAGSLSENVHLKEFKYHLFNGKFLNFIDPHMRIGLFRYVRQIKPDIIHGHLVKGEDFSKALGALTNTPVLATSHDIVTKPSYKTLFLNRYLSKAIAVSGLVSEYLHTAYKLSRDKIEVIPNAIDTSQFKNSKKTYDSKKPIFIYIGRLLKSKGIEDAILGLAKLQQEYPKLEFLIYGKEVFPSYKRHLDSLVKKNKYDFVKFMGRTDDVPAALKKGDIFILPSETEGFAISVLEAAAAGKPVIATKTGAIPDIVAQGKSGLFVEWGKPDQIFQAGKKMLSKNLVESYGSFAQKSAYVKFDISGIINTYVDLYHSLAKR